jgi:hypothetical protein
MPPKKTVKTIESTEKSIVEEKKTKKMKEDVVLDEESKTKSPTKTKKTVKKNVELEEETKPETKPETKAETVPETKAETVPETKPETKTKGKAAKKNDVDNEVVKPSTKAAKGKTAKKNEPVEEAVKKNEHVEETVSSKPENTNVEEETQVTKSLKNNASDVEKLLEEKKKEWANVATQIHALNAKRDQLEIEQKNIVKELTDLMNKLRPSVEGFILDSSVPKNVNKSTSKIVKKEIIPMDAESESETTEDEEESESEDKRPELLPKKGANKKIFDNKTSKQSKALKLTKHDSESESDK